MERKKIVCILLAMLLVIGVFVPASAAGNTITVSGKTLFYVGNNVSFYYYNYKGSASIGPYYTTSGIYFNLSNGGIGYCVEPHNHATTGNFTESTWGDYSTEAREGIFYALAYGAPNNGDTSPEAVIATACLVWDMALGYRDSTGQLTGHGNPPFITNACGDGRNPSNAAVKAKYNEILDRLQNHRKIPSFAVPFASQITDANTITLTYDETSGTYKGSATDTNGILVDYNFTSNISGLTFTVSGNTLNVTATPEAAAQLANGVNFSAAGHCYEIGDHSAIIWEQGDSQKFATLPGKIDPVSAYIRITAGPANGELTIQKTTNTGTNLSDWQFNIYSDSACKNLVEGPVTSGSDGTIAVTLAPGTYYVAEVPKDDAYWVCDTGVKTVTLSAGGTGSVVFSNTQYGKISVRKETNTGKNLSGWTFGVYSDPECTQTVTTLTTSLDGTAVSDNLEPGPYYVKEIPKDDEYWECDTSVKSVTVAAGQTTPVGGTDGTFTNIHYGKVKIIKSMKTDGPVEGWQFEVYRQEETGDPSSPLGTAISLKHVGTYTSAADGTILSDNLEPGTYVVQEIIPEDSLYYCETENPQTITVAAGETAQVFFTNALKPGKITVEKVNLQGEHLTGVKFLLEWSQNGTTWTPVVHSDNESVILGGCTSEGLADGCLVTGADGFVTFEGLYPGIQYRLSEVDAPEGYVLLSDYAFQGELPAEDFTVTLTVVNASTFTLPMTGSNTLALMPIALTLCMAVCVGALLYCRKK